MWWDKYVRAANVLDKMLVEMDSVTDFSDAKRIINPYKERTDLNFDFYQASGFLLKIFLISFFVFGVALLSLSIKFSIDGLVFVFGIPAVISFILVFYYASVANNKDKSFRTMEKKIYSLAFKSKMQGKKIAGLKEYITKDISLLVRYRASLSDFLVRTSYEGKGTKFDYNYIHTLMSYNLQRTNGTGIAYRAIDFLALDFHFDAEVFVAKGRSDRFAHRRKIGIDSYKTTSNMLNKSHTILATEEDGAKFFTPAVTALFEEAFETLDVTTVKVMNGGIVFGIEESPLNILLTKYSHDLSEIVAVDETIEFKSQDKIIKFSDELCRLLDVNLKTAVDRETTGQPFVS